jgi:integrase
MESVDPIRDRRQVAEMSRYLRRWNEKYYLLFEFGIHTGLRISDLQRLTFGHIIDEYASGRRRWAERVRIREKKTMKTNRERSILIRGTELENVIRGCLSPITAWDLSSPLFPSRYMSDEGIRALGEWQVRHVLKRAAEACGVPGRIGTHTLRKTFGHHYYKETKDVATLQSLFAHSSPSITLRYIGITQDDHDTAYKKVRFSTQKASSF